MKNKHDELQKKNARLKRWLIVLSCVVIGLIIFIAVTQIMESKSSQSPATSTEPSIRVVSTSSSEAAVMETSSLDSTQANVTSSSSSESAEPATASPVIFPKGAILRGENEQLKFAMTTYTQNDDLVISYGPNSYISPDAHMSEMAAFVPITSPETTIQVDEEGTLKTVKVTTELKLSVGNGSKPSQEFFTPFNGNDTKIYAYLNDHGNITLAFTPAGHNGAYTTISLQEK
ncbi:hypothetical protein [Enterococcus sp.]|uniref:hypothetical protein n=1 Tax=Enterococcus sp. TaxID=35783 RepID=UPI00290EABD9|nr:hypothetical protein [Enterococcus sp.]MDU5334986.1 hypothetical protein [Enterococcus sp.]